MNHKQEGGHPWRASGKGNNKKNCRSLTKQAENVCPYRDACQQSPLFILHLPGPLAESQKNKTLSTRKTRNCKMFEN